MSDVLCSVSGAKGGGSRQPQRAPIEEPNTLRSKAVVRIIDVISEGEIVGLAEGAKSIILGGTPIVAADGSVNIKGVTYELKVGLPDQSPAEGFSEVEVPIIVRAQVAFATPVTKTLTGAQFDAARVTLRFPQLVEIIAQYGDQVKTKVHVKVEVRRSAPTVGDWLVRVDQDIEGKNTRPYEESYYFPLPKTGSDLGATAWDIRVSRTTADSASSNLLNDTYFEVLTGIVESRMMYPDSAYVALTFDASIFPGDVPEREYDTVGIVCDVPSNYDPVTRTYAGIWDGTLKRAWTDCPPWVFYYLVTNERFGLGERIPAELMDTAALYTIGQYCDGLVDDGRGGTEPRFTFNGTINTREEAYTHLQALAAVFRGMTYWGAGAIVATQDSPAEPVKLITPANVIDGEFLYEGTGLSTRHSVAIVTWADQIDAKRIGVEVVEDPEMIDRIGYEPVDILAPYCTSQAQARRLGKWLLDSERTQRATVTWKASLDQIDLMPGEMVEIADPKRQLKRLHGRVGEGPSTTVIPLDASLSLESGHSYRLRVTLPDADIEERAVIVPVPGTYAALELDEPLSLVPLEGAVYIIVDADNRPSQWRMIGNRELETGIHQMLAVMHDPGKYARVESGLVLDPPETVPLRPAGVVQPPGTPTVSRQQRWFPTRSQIDLVVSWAPSPDPFLDIYVVSYRADSGNWQTLRQSSTLEAELKDVMPGTYDFQVVARSVFGLHSAPRTVSYSIAGLSAAGLNLITGLQVDGGGLTFFGRDLAVTWASYSVSDPTGAATAKRDGVDAFFRRFKVTVKSADGLTTLRTDHVATPTYLYSYDRNLEDGGPFRSVRIEVQLEDKAGGFSTPAVLVASNPQPAIDPGSVSITATPLGMRFKYARPLDPDFRGIRVHAATSTGFTPTAGNLVYQGLEEVFDFYADPGQTIFVKYAAFDDFGIDAIAYTQASGSFTAIKIDQDGIANNAIRNQHVLKGGLTVDRLSVGGIGGLSYIDNPLFEVAGAASLAEWLQGNGTSTVTAEDASVSAPAGAPTLRVARIVPKLSTNERIVTANPKPCLPGDKMVLRVKAAAGAGTSAALWYGVFWLDRNKGQIGGGHFVSIPVTGAWGEYSAVTAQAPAGTCFVQFSLVVIAAAAPAGAWYICFTEQRKQVPGVEVVDGGITAVHLAADSVDANAVRTRSLTTDKLIVLDVNNLCQNPDAATADPQWWENRVPLSRITTGLPAGARRTTAWRAQLGATAYSQSAGDPRLGLDSLIYSQVTDPNATLFVTGGSNYTFRTEVALSSLPASGATRVWAGIAFYDATGSFIGSMIQGVVSIPGASTWKIATVTAKAPDNAYWAVATLQIDNTANAAFTGTPYLTFTASYIGRAITAGAAHAKTSASITCPVLTYTTVQSVTLFCTGATVQVTAQFTALAATPGSNLRICRDGVAVLDTFFSTPDVDRVVAYWTDTPGTGVHTYTLELGNGTGGFDVADRLLSVVDLGAG